MMKNLRKSLLLVMMLALVLAVGCGGNTEKKELGLGETKDGVYKNEYFGLEVNVPEEWNSLDEEEIKKINDEAAELLSGDDEELKKKFENVDERRNLTFLTVYEHELDYQGINVNYSVAAEKLTFLHELAIKNGEDYLKQIQEQLPELPLPYEVDEEIVTEKINDVDWYKLHTKIVFSEELKVDQDYYCVIRNGYAIYAIYTYTEEVGKEDMMEIIKSMKVNKE